MPVKISAQTLLCGLSLPLLLATSCHAYVASVYQLRSYAATETKLSGDLPKAERLYRQLLAMSEAGDDPTAARNIEQSRYELAEVLEKEEKFDEAIVLYQKILTKNPQYYQSDVVKLRIVETLVKSKKFAEAGAMLSKMPLVANTFRDGKLSAQVLKAIVAYKCGRKEECAGHLNELMNMAVKYGLPLEAGIRTKPDPANIDAVAEWLGANGCVAPAILIYQVLLDDAVKSPGWSDAHTVKLAIALVGLRRGDHKSPQHVRLLDTALKAQIGTNASAVKLELLAAKEPLLTHDLDRLATKRQRLQLAIESNQPFYHVVSQFFYEARELEDKLNRKNESHALAQSMLVHCEKVYGKNSHEVADILKFVAADAASENNYQLASDLNARAIAIIESLHKPESVVSLAYMFSNQATYCEHLNKHDKAIALNKRLIAMFDSIHQEPPLLMFLPAYQSQLVRLGHITEANAIKSRIEDIYRKYQNGRGMIAFVDPGTVSKW